MSTSKVWLGAGVIFVSLFSFKQILWYFVQNQIVENRERDNLKAVNALKESRERAKQYYLEPLSKEDLDRLIKLKGHDYAEVQSFSKGPVRSNNDNNK